MLFSTKIAELQAKLTEAEGKVTVLTGEKEAIDLKLKEFEEANADFGARYTSDQASIKALTEERDTLLKAKGELTTKLEAAEKGVQTEVVKRIASAHVPAIQKVDNAATPDAAPPGPGRTKATWGRDFSAAA